MSLRISTTPVMDSVEALSLNAPIKKARTGIGAGLGIKRLSRRNQLPATIIFSISTEPVRMLLRSSRSLPTATICLNISRMLPAMVTS